MDEEFQLSKDELLAEMQAGWEAFNAYLATLSDEQLTGPTDAAGWTAKDHVAHLARWEEGMIAVFDGQNRPEAMGVDEVTWKRWNFDEINEVLRQRDVGKSLAEVKQLFHDVHDRLMARLETLSDEDLQRPYRHYQPQSSNEAPVIAHIGGNTYEHYEEHRPWIEAIVNRA